MRILHITSWYPNKENPFEAIWIERLIESLSAYYSQEVWQIAARPGSKLTIERSELKEKVNQIIWTIPTDRWFFVEIVNSLLLFYYLLVKRVHKEYDVINFHIAYPQLTYWHFLKHFIKKPVVISEHWSAYHFNFGLPANRNLKRIKRIFRNKLPLIVVSESLKDDVRLFSGCSPQSVFVIPNLVNTALFCRDPEIQKKADTFFMVSQWKWPKDPFIVIKAFAEFAKGKDSLLKIGGYGVQMQEMKQLVIGLEIEKKVEFIGEMTSVEIMKEMNAASAFLLGSVYETFSVVCAEAICCGTPVIASGVGGIVEFINDSNGLLIEDGQIHSWVRALHQVGQQSFDYESIARQASAYFCRENVGRLYQAAVESVYKSHV